jgi:hypothetical protein
MIKIYFKLGLFLLLSQNFTAKAAQNKNIAIDTNLLLFANQGFGINSELKIINSLSVGADGAIFLQNPYNTNGVVANRTIFTLSLKLHYFLFANEMYGPFIGAKLNFTSSQSRISDSDTTSQSNVFYVAPIIQVGYRFVTKNGFTVSAYAGAGIKSTTNNFDQSNIPASKANNTDWLAAKNKLNKNISRFEPDYGLTLGYIF